MRARTYLTLALGVVATLGALEGAAAQAPARDAAVTAVDDRFQVAGAPDGTSDVTILAEGSVAFEYASGNSRHNVRFTDAQPTECALSGSSDPVPPLPQTPQPPGWRGSCTFRTPGAYPFLCDQHPRAMRGTVTVVAPPEPTASPTPTPAPAPEPAPSPAPAQDPGTAPASPPPDVTSPPAAAPAGVAAARLRLVTVPRAARVRGSVDIKVASSRLRVDVLARRSALRRRGRGLLRVAHLARARLRVGRTAFSLRINRAARRALARRGRLALTIKVIVTPPTGARFMATRHLTIRARRRP
jgi:plastocyanin